MGPEHELPLPPSFDNEEEYVNSLLNLLGTNDLLRVLCGGVHILDFFTSEPSLYSRIFPVEWRDFFAQHQIMDLLDFFLREDLDVPVKTTWREGSSPPESLVEYLVLVRKHLLLRGPGGSQCARNRALKPMQKMARHVSVGMNVKKVHEVGLFAHYIDHLTKEMASSEETAISHLVDFGSGQNYLGRALASEPYNHKIVAIESKSHNAERAKEFDIMARLADKEQIMRNKKAFRSGQESANGDGLSYNHLKSISGLPMHAPNRDSPDNGSVEVPALGSGKIQYVEHRISDGDLSLVVPEIEEPNANLLVISLHSCGNLVHHGLRSLVMNPAVKAVAMVGCCYNLVTERLGSSVNKLPELRPTTYTHGRLARLANQNDPHGFPMSERFCEQPMLGNEQELGVRLNITARMMAVQAPFNWGATDSESFFKRHFYRALLQRIFLDRGIVGPPTPDCVGGLPSVSDIGSGGTPIVIGSLRKACYATFILYVRGALEKLCTDEYHGPIFHEKMGSISDTEISWYEVNYAERMRDLSVTWSLMAFSAGVVEAAIVVDRWSWLKEQGDVRNAWVEPVFDYAFSPRNLVVVGIKR